MEDQRLSRRDFLRTSAIAALVMGGLAACTPAAPPAPGTGSGQSAAGAAGASAAAPAAAAVTLAFVCDIINEGHVKVRDKWAADFAAANPGITVQHQPTPNADYNTKIQTLFAAGTPPDIYRYLTEITPIVTVAQKNMHVQLDDYIAADNVDLSDFRPDAVALYKWEDKTYALPATTATRTSSTMWISLTRPASSCRRWTGKTRASPLRSSWTCCSGWSSARATA